MGMNPSTSSSTKRAIEAYLRRQNRALYLHAVEESKAKKLKEITLEVLIAAITKQYTFKYVRARGTFTVFKNNKWQHIGLDSKPACKKYIQGNALYEAKLILRHIEELKQLGFEVTIK